jgi:hypothetical protein
MTLTSELSATVPSASVGFRAKLQNQSDAILRGQLYVDVVNKENGASVERFLVPQQFALLSKSAGESDFVWKTSGALTSGTYIVRATLVNASTTRADALSLALGPSAQTPITISDGVPEASFSAIHVNGTQYQAGSVVRISSGSAQVVAATLNSTSAPFKGTLTWRLYAADALLSAAPLDTRTVVVDLHPGTTADVSYTLAQTSASGYYLEGALSDGKSTSYIDVWLAKDSTVFPELGCISAGTMLPVGSNTGLILAGIALVILIGVVWEVYEKRRA